MIKVLDNFIPLKIQNKYIDLLDSQEIAWFFMKDLVVKENEFNFKNKNITDTFAMVHTLFGSEGVNSNFYDFFQTILTFFRIKEKVDIKDIIRIRIRRTFPSKEHTKDKYNVPHIDVKDHLPYKTLLYYVDDSDGDTIFFKNKITNDILLDSEAVEDQRVSPKKGRAIYFDGGIYHSGNCPIDFDKRTVINFDFKT